MLLPHNLLCRRKKKGQTHKKLEWSERKREHKERQSWSEIRDKSRGNKGEAEVEGERGESDKIEELEGG